MRRFSDRPVSRYPDSDRLKKETEMTTKGKVLRIVILVAVYLGIVVWMFTYNAKDRIYTEGFPETPLVIDVDGFETLVLSERAAMTITSLKPFRVETQDGPIDSTFLDTTHFQVGPVEVAGEVNSVYSDSRMHIEFVHERSLRVRGVGIEDGITFAVPIVSLFGVFFTIVICFFISDAAPPRES